MLRAARRISTTSRNATDEARTLRAPVQISPVTDHVVTQWKSCNEPLEMSDVLEQILSWSAFVRCGPADQVWSATEENRHNAIAGRCSVEATVNKVPGCTTGEKRGRRREDPLHAVDGA